MACSVRARTATSRLGYAWRSRKMVESDCSAVVDGCRSFSA